MSNNQQSYVVNVEAAIYNSGEYLITERAAAEEHAAGMWSLVGGTVEESDEDENVLERTVRREIREEVGITVSQELDYIESRTFVTDTGDRVVNVVFLCQHDGGTAHINEPDEIASIQWLTAEEIAVHPDIPPWTQQSIVYAETERTAHNQ